MDAYVSELESRIDLLLTERTDMYAEIESLEDDIDSLKRENKTLRGLLEGIARRKKRLRLDRR